VRLVTFEHGGPPRLGALRADLVVDPHAVLTADAARRGTASAAEEAADAPREMVAFFVEVEATKRHATGMSPEEAMRDINLGRFGELDERGRLAQNELAVHYELDPTLDRVDTVEVFSRIADLEGWVE